ncbi:hypothetical protein CO659_12905 [Rhizobium sp. S9]|uniref:hypothetical protein n=1 Tax=Rhizobium sp. S9 TaxID=2035454 RepID=UPI000BE894C6|nr:hypothetical protein [Rhizobium sp. S9]PDS97554.1 hypothetical protein CO659_12905 [Rhizobium sp. S9]
MKLKVKSDSVPLGCILPFIAIVISTIPAWFTHVYVCLMAGKWGFLIAGAICAPIAVVHGWGIWLGVW